MIYFKINNSEHVRKLQHRFAITQTRDGINPTSKSVNKNAIPVD